LLYFSHCSDNIFLDVDFVWFNGINANFVDIFHGCWLPDVWINDMWIYFFLNLEWKNRVCVNYLMSQSLWWDTFLKHFGWMSYGVLGVLNGVTSNCKAIHEVMKQVPQYVGHDIHSLLELYSLSG
jgi:hypothetical protein